MSAIRVLVPEAVGALIEARVAYGEYANSSDYVSDLIFHDQPLSAEGAQGSRNSTPPSRKASPMLTRVA